MRRPLSAAVALSPGARAWIALAVGVFVYNRLAPEGHMLSEQVDRWLEAHPFVTRAAVDLVARHLTNDLPERVDPFTWIFLAARWRPAAGRR